MCHVWLSSSYKISCLGKSAYLSGNDTKLWMQSAETRCNGAIEEPWHVVAWKATELLPWMSLLSLLAKLPGVFLVILSLGHNTKTHGSKFRTFKQAQPEVTSSNGMDMDGSPTWMSYKSFCTCAEQPPEPGSPQVNTVPSKNTTAIAWVNKTLNKKTWGTKKWHIQHKHLNDWISDTFGLTSAFIVSTGTAHPLTAGSWAEPQVSFHPDAWTLWRRWHPLWINN